MRNSIKAHRRPSSLRALALPLLILAALLVSACASNKNKDEFFENSTEQELFRAAERNLRTGNFEAAINAFRRLEARFPFGRYAEQAQLELIYAHHMNWDPDSADAAAERFIRLHPQHPNVDFAYYMRGRIALSRDRGGLIKFMSSPVARRDVSNLREAFVHFAVFTEKFPRSEYAKDARQRMIYLRNMLAESEIHIALYYMSRRAFVAAANRARSVIANYSQTPSTPDALAILIEASWYLGLTETANDTMQVLAVNYPDYPGFNEQGDLVLDVAIKNRDRSWANMVSFGLIDRPKPLPPLKLNFQEDTDELKAFVIPEEPEDDLAETGLGGLYGTEALDTPEGGDPGLGGTGPDGIGPDGIGAGFAETMPSSNETEAASVSDETGALNAAIEPETGDLPDDESEAGTANERADERVDERVDEP